MNGHLIHDAKGKYLKFIDSCHQGDVDFSLTPRSEPSGYARCFAVFGLNLLHAQQNLEYRRSRLIDALRNEIRAMRAQYQETPIDKPYRQLLAFTLSALAVLDGLGEDPLAELVLEQIPDDVSRALVDNGCLEGKAQSGNQAMFLAIFLLHAQSHLDQNVTGKLKNWIDLHLSSMNQFGFWGPGKGMRHLLFQNGYHQYEILEYLGITNTKMSETISAVEKLADAKGHFAPYPGGGGCYDYDAIFMLAPYGKIPNDSVEKLLRRTADTLLSEQTQEGGWCESLNVRPRSIAQLSRFFYHVVTTLPNLNLFYERLRYALTLQRPKHDQIKTHWSKYSREWGEANLWDSWFRLLTIARIQVAIDPDRSDDWGFIDYPGIGYHPALRSKLQQSSD